jgi:hypothetical protein
VNRARITRLFAQLTASPPGVREAHPYSVVQGVCVALCPRYRSINSKTQTRLVVPVPESPTANATKKAYQSTLVLNIVTHKRKMNDSIYWDNLDPGYSGAPLACAPHGGDPNYASVCQYTNQLSPVVTLLNALWFFYSAHQQVLLVKQSQSHTPGTPGMQSPIQTASSTNKAKSWNFRKFPGLIMKFVSAVPPGARVSIVLGVSTLCSSLWSFIGGSGTAYAPEALRGLLGDTLGESFCGAQSIVCVACEFFVCYSCVFIPSLPSFVYCVRFE